jgi:hypothetical protein
MNTITITIKDEEEGLSMEGRVEDQTAFDRPPTAALIVGSYLAAKTDQICKDALAWFQSEVVSDITPEEKQ